RDDENAPNKLQVIDVKVNTSSTDPNIISTWSQTASLCKGDSGGPLFQSNTGKTYTIMGIASTATRCDMFFISKFVKNPVIRLVSIHVIVRRTKKAWTFWFR
ncbi:hypothetical protein OESDEN_23065, partial [Oesophagostomum dentatum]